MAAIGRSDHSESKVSRGSAHQREPPRSLSSSAKSAARAIPFRRLPFRKSGARLMLRLVFVVMARRLPEGVSYHSTKTSRNISHVVSAPPQRSEEHTSELQSLAYL